MANGLFATIFGDGSAGERGAASFFECTVCDASFSEWPAACPDCGQLVVRVVDRPTSDGACDASPVTSRGAGDR